MKQVANGFDYKVGTFERYNINGYHFRTHENEERRAILKSRNIGVSAICNGVEYYGRLDEIGNFTKKSKAFVILAKAFFVGVYFWGKKSLFYRLEKLFREPAYAEHQRN